MAKKSQEAQPDRDQDQSKWRRWVMKCRCPCGKHGTVESNSRPPSEPFNEASNAVDIPANANTTNIVASGNTVVGSTSSEADVCATTIDANVSKIPSGDLCTPSLDATKPKSTTSRQNLLWDEALKKIASDRGEGSHQDDKIIDCIQEFTKQADKQTAAESNPHDLASIKEQLEKAIAGKKAENEARAWTIIIGNKEHSVRGFVEKTVKLLNKFTPIADLAVSADPVHAALPWAAVRLALMAVTSGSKLESDITFGLATVTTLIIYCDTYQALYLDSDQPSHIDSSVFDHLRKAIIKAYVQSLLFLGFAHLQHDRGNAIALFKVEAMGTYIQELTSIENELIQAADICEKVCVHDDRAEVKRLRQLMEGIHEEINNQEKSLAQIYKAIQLSDLKTRLAEGAEYESLANENDPKCYKGTRVDLLCAIQAWFGNLKGRPIYWLQGKAGTGKSTISRTIAETLHESGEPNASFFFKRGVGDRSHAGRFFTTISYQLCRKWCFFAECVAEAIRQDYNIMAKPSRQQLEKLILEPLRELGKKKYGILRILVVVDALDECDEDDHIKNIICLLPEVKSLEKDNVYLKFFLTSRPETHLRHGFNKIEKDHKEAVLHDISENLVQKDISAYLKYELSSIRDDYNKVDETPLEEGWPGEEKMRNLAQMACPLFIFAATVCRFLRRDPRGRLELVLKENTKTYDDKLNMAYGPVLRRLLQEDENSSAEEQVINRFQNVVGSIVLLEEPLSVSSLALLLGMESSDIGQAITPLDSVLNIPKRGSDVPIRTFHLSFPEYLLDKNRNKEEKLHIDQEKAHENLANKCLELLKSSGGLKEDICSPDKPAKNKKEIDEHTIDNHIPRAVQYGCRYWIRHMIKSKVKIDDQHPAYEFLQEHFLHWIEALSFIGRLLEGLDLIQDLQAAVDPNSGEELLGFLRDANRFILHSYAAIDQTPLQLYSSALLFAPEASIVRQCFQEHIDWIVHKPIGEGHWSPCLQRLDDNDNAVVSIAVSGNGKLIASVSYTGVVRVWDAATRVLRCTFEGRGGSLEAALSGDGRLVACGSGYKINIWDTETGALRHALDIEQWIDSVAFSNTGRLAAGTQFGKVKVWVASTGNLEKEWQGHEKWVRAVAYSEDSTLLATGSDDKAVEVWDTATGELKATLTGHTNDVISVAFSHDGKLLASASDDSTVKIWDTATFKLQHTLQSASTVWSVAFSRDSKLLASTSGSGINVRDMATQKLQHTFKGHPDTVTSLAFRDNRLMVSGSRDRTIKIWDITQPNLQQTFQGHDRFVTSIAFSADDKLIASRSSKTIRVWDAIEGTLHPEISNEINDDEDRICSFAFSPDNKHLALGSSRGSISIRNTLNGRLEYTLEGRGAEITSIAFSADGNLIASGDDDGTVKIWNAMARTLLHTINEGTCAIKSIAFSIDRKLIAFGHERGTVKIWDAVAEAPLGIPDDHTQPVGSIEFSPDGNLLSSLAFNEIKVWDLAQRALQQKIDVPKICNTLSFPKSRSHLLVDPLSIPISLATSLDGEDAQDSVRTDGDIEHSTSDQLEAHFECLSRAQNTTALPSGSYGLGSNLTWVTRDGEELIWIHPDHRPLVPEHSVSPRPWAVSRSRKMIAMGFDSGRVIRIGFK